MSQYFIDLKQLVEETYKLNNDVPISFIAHSMGAPMLMIFLQNQTNAWKDKYIARMITIAGAYGGSAKAVKVFAVGDDLGAFGLFASEMKEQQRSMPSLAFLLPFPAFWKPNEVLVSTRKRNYTHSQMKEFFEDIGYPTAWEMRKDNLKFVENFAAPNVEIHCLYSSQMPTIERMIYKSDDLTANPDLVMGNGDGSVNIRSLEGCTYWRGLQKKPITTLEIPKSEHFAVLGHPQIVSYVLDVLVN